MEGVSNVVCEIMQGEGSHTPGSSIFASYSFPAFRAASIRAALAVAAESSTSISKSPKSSKPSIGRRKERLVDGR
jgi:hypothetical protein